MNWTSMGHLAGLAICCLLTIFLAMLAGLFLIYGPRAFSGRVNHVEVFISGVHNAVEKTGKFFGQLLGDVLVNTFRFFYRLGEIKNKQ